MSYDNTARRIRYQTDEAYRNKVKKQRQDYLKRNPKSRLQTTLRSYGLTVIQYEAMLQKQDYKCAICESPEFNSKRINRMCVDHDHETGKVRGLLCAACNRALGLFRDSDAILSKAVNYLGRNKN